MKLSICLMVLKCPCWKHSFGITRTKSEITFLLERSKAWKRLKTLYAIDVFLKWWCIHFVVFSDCFKVQRHFLSYRNYKAKTCKQINIYLISIILIIIFRERVYWNWGARMHLYFVCQEKTGMKNWDVPASKGHDSKVRS